MAYNKTNWKDRMVEKPRTFKAQNNPDGTITLIPMEGTIVEAGTPINAENMNKIENEIEALDNGKADKKIYGDAGVLGTDALTTSSWSIGRDGNAKCVTFKNKTANINLALYDNGVVRYNEQQLIKLDASSTIDTPGWRIYRDDTDKCVIVDNKITSTRLAMFDDGTIKYNGQQLLQLKYSSEVDLPTWKIARDESNKKVHIWNKTGNKLLALYDNGKVVYGGHTLADPQNPLFEQSIELGTNKTVTVTHNLGYKPLTEVSTTLGNVNVTWQHVDNNTIKLFNYSTNEATAYIRCW